MNHFDRLNKVGMKVITLLGKGLGLPDDFFVPWFEKDNMSILRSLHYLPRPDDVKQAKNLTPEQLKVNMIPHTDSGFLTFLSTFGFPGLQVNMGGKYLSPEPMENAFVVNIGDTLNIMTNGKLKSTLHQVIDIGRERYSSPFFFQPKYSTLIPLAVAKKQIGRNDLDLAVGKDYIMYGDFLIQH